MKQVVRIVNFMCEYKKKFHANLPVGRQGKKSKDVKKEFFAPLREIKFIK